MIKELSSLHSKQWQIPDHPAFPRPPPSPFHHAQGPNVIKELLAPYTAADYRALFEQGRASQEQQLY